MTRFSQHCHFLPFLAILPGVTSFAADPNHFDDKDALTFGQTNAVCLVKRPGIDEYFAAIRSVNNRLNSPRPAAVW